MTDKPIPGFTAAMRAACAKTAGKFWNPFQQFDLTAHAYARACEDAANAIRAMPVAPPFPEPMRQAPDRETKVWCADPSSPDFAMMFTWRGSNGDLISLTRGLCHAVFEDAATHGWYLASLSAKPEGGA